MEYGPVRVASVDDVPPNRVLLGSMRTSYDEEEVPFWKDEELITPVVGPKPVSLNLMIKFPFPGELAVTLRSSWGAVALPNTGLVSPTFTVKLQPLMLPTHSTCPAAVLMSPSPLSGTIMSVEPLISSSSAPARARQGTKARVIAPATTSGKVLNLILILQTFVTCFFDAPR